jgi:rhodanese-related sulfurtransferase
MNRFLKTNMRWLGLLGLALMVVILAFIFRPGTREYHFGVNETLLLLNEQSNKIEVKEIDGKTLIDIRPANLYAQGHPEGAINLPIRQLLDKESIRVLDEVTTKGEVILYGSDELQATAPCYLLQQLGYKKIRILRGGYTFANEFRESEKESAEVPIFDPSSFKVQPDLAKATELKVERKKVEVVAPVRKAASSGGGC